jgi:hypothetical protein
MGLHSIILVWSGSRNQHLQYLESVAISLVLIQDPRGDHFDHLRSNIKTQTAQVSATAVILLVAGYKIARLF